jgi:hypothetical protein
MTHFIGIGDAKRKRSEKPRFYWEFEDFANSEWKRRGSQFLSGPRAQFIPARQPVEKLWIPPFHLKRSAGKARRKRIPFIGLRLRSNKAAARFLMKPFGLSCRSAYKTKNPLSGDVQSFSRGC